MPQVTVYVRKDDLPKWEALEKKSEFLHNALNRVPSKEVKKPLAAQAKSISYKTTQNWGA